MVFASDMKHILIISGDPRILAEIKAELMDHFDVSIAANSTAAIAAMEMYDMSIIVNYVCENREKAFSVFTDIFDSARNKGIPIIFLTGKGNDEDEITAFALGAVDYSARRSGATKALIDRIKLRINASEYEKKLLGHKVSHSGDFTPEAALVNKTILVADDVELNRDIVAAMLSEIEGLTVEFAADGKEAVEKFTKDPSLYSLIFMDVQMPVMDGLEATRIIRSQKCDHAREIPIIAVTADAEEEDVELCHKAGMNAFIEKPMAYDKILAIAAEHCPVKRTGSKL